MASLCYLCSVSEIDKDYQHVLDFNSTSSRRSFFNNKVLKVVEVDFKGDEFREELTIPLSLQNVLKIDYLFFTGDDGKDYFYFVDNKEYVTSDVCKLFLTLDVFTTYQFDFTFKHSFVERCHVDRWQNGNINRDNVSVDEGFPTHDYFVSKYKRNVYDLINNGTNIYITSTPLSKIGKGGGGIYDEFDPTLTPVSTKCTASNGDIYTYPTTGYVTAGTPSYPSNGNPTGGNAHYGIDIGAPSGEPDSKLRPIYAPYVGTVIAINEGTSGYGNNVRMTCDDQGNGETYHIFAHLYKFSDIKVGQRVTKSTVLGYMGNSGNSTGKHLHWEISPNGTFNTTNYITPDKEWKSKWQSEVK